MAITVTTPTVSQLSINQGSRASASIVVKKAGDTTLQSLNNVVATDLQDGYTLVYNATTNKFVTQPLGNVSLNVVDGGTY